MEYFCAGVSEMYGPRGEHFSKASHTTILVASMEEDGTTLLNSPLGLGRQLDFPLPSFLCYFTLKYFSSPAILITQYFTVYL